MRKPELAAAIAEKTDLSKEKAAEVINVVTDRIAQALAEGDSVSLIGFGTFASGKRAARMGRNPKTGEPLKIAAAKTVKFSAGKAFKDSVNKRKK